MLLGEDDLLRQVPGLGLTALQKEQILRHWPDGQWRFVFNRSPHLLTEIKGIGHKKAQQIQEKWSHIESEAPEVLFWCEALGLVYPQAQVIIKTIHPDDRPALQTTPWEFENQLPFLSPSHLNKQRHLPWYQSYQTYQNLKRHQSNGDTVLTIKTNNPHTKQIGSLLQSPVDYHTEQTIARFIARALRQEHPVKHDFSDILSFGIGLLTGGPGTGKSTLTKQIVETYHHLGLTTLCLAPTGRAAKRLSDATGTLAYTIHSALGYDLTHNDLKHHRYNPWSYDLIIIDEFSMVDMYLFAQVIDAIPVKGQLLCIGDPQQLPSIKNGQLLRDMIDIKLPHRHLSTNHRLAQQDSHLSKTVTKLWIQPPISSSISPLEAADWFTPKEKQGSDLYYFAVSSSQFYPLLENLMTRSLPNKLGFMGSEQIQLLSPYHQGETGTLALNRFLQNIWNPSQNNTAQFRVGDKVMCQRNIKQTQLCNGDWGYIQAFVTPTIVSVDWGDRVCSIETTDIELAYAMSVHKSQGSEFEVVILPCFKSTPLNLFYTALTRTRSLAIVIGSDKVPPVQLSDQKRKTALPEHFLACFGDDRL
jgi:RecD/TraA family predicted helicase